MNLLKNTIGALLVLSLCVITTGCGQSKIELVNLDRVLSILEGLLDEPEYSNFKPDSSEEGKDAIESQATKDFLKEYASRLNKAKLVSFAIGVEINSTGAIEGFKDSNKDLVKNAGESRLFVIEIDSERERLIATDMQGYRRDHRYTTHGGFFRGYLLGSMMNRHNGYYSSRTAPDYGNMSMSPKNYHASAVSSLNSKSKSSSSSSARSRSGTGSYFGFGK